MVERMPWFLNCFEPPQAHRREAHRRDSNRREARRREARRKEEAFPRLHCSIKEIAHTEVVKSIGANRFGSCYLGKYWGILAVKEFCQLLRANAQTIKYDVSYEAAVISRLGDHPGLLLLFGISSVQMPYRLITQFHEHQDESLIIHKAIQKRLLGSAIWIEVMRNGRFPKVHKMGFLHNDLEVE